MAVDEAGLELVLSLVDGPVPVQGVPHLALAAVPLEQVVIVVPLLLVGHHTRQFEQKSRKGRIYYEQKSSRTGRIYYKTEV